MQRDVEIIVDLRAFALRDHIGGDGVGHREQQQRLVDHVRPKVAQHPAARLWNLAPALLDIGPEAVPMRLEQQDFAKLRKHLSNRQEIAVPPPVVEHAEHAVLPPCQSDQRIRFVERDGERLVDDDMFARVQSRRGNVEVRRVGRRHHHQIGALEQLVESADALGRIARRQHRREIHPLASTDQRRVEGRTGETVAGEADADHGAPH